MTRFTLIFILLLAAFFSNAQVPNQFKYQSVARDAFGVLDNTQVGLRVSIHNLSPTGTVVFQETHFVWTNDFGLFSLNIGAGTPVTGTIQSVDWSIGAKFIEIEADLLGGTNYLAYGTSELLSVPYALYSASSGSSILPNGTGIGNTSFWDGSSWVVDNNNLYNAGEFVGLGTASPLQKLDVNGNINIPLDSCYMIDNRRMFWINGNNIFIGENAGNSISFGTSNTYMGYDSGTANSVGSQNTFYGTETGRDNNAGSMGTFIGNRAGLSNTIGNENTFIGAYAGQYTTEGQHNSFLGVTAGSSNSSGSENTFLGAHAGYFNTIGSYNTLLGNFSGENSGTGNYNTSVGFEADFATANLNNSMALGSGAIVSSNNTVVVGNTAVISIGGQVGWSTLSDRRLKNHIQDNRLGLDFINRLNTVSYTYKAKGQKGIRYSGLIAQEVESIIDDMGLEFSGVVRPTNKESYYSLRYSEFVIPLIKAVQEQSTEIKELTDRISELEDSLRLILEEQKK
jgi:hypothetical protein